MRVDVREFRRLETAGLRASRDDSSAASRLLGEAALLVQGEMWLQVGADTRHLLPGDTLALEREVPHAERYGREGATYWVARSH
jgi:predicted exporter